MTSPDIPPQAITAATEAIRKRLSGTYTAKGLAMEALEAAAPLIRAAEQERCAQLAENLLTQWGLDARRLRSAGANEIDRAVARRLDTCAQEVADLLREQP